jgi:sugar lactone lactonase YvrE
MAILCVAAARLLAQTPVDNSAVDSANVARAAWMRAVRSDDLAVSRREVERAAAAWPTQQSYLWGRAIFAARARDTTATLTALDAYADLDLGRDLTNPEFDFVRRLPSFGAIAARHVNNRSDLVRSTIVGRLSDSTFWPEGVDYDPVSRSYYVASVRHGTVARTDDKGTQVLWPADSLALGAVLGARVDSARRTLWVTTSGIPQNANFQPGDTALAALIEFDLGRGRILRTWRFPVATGGHVLGDLTIAPDGSVWISDSVQPVLYRLRPNADTLESYRSPLFRSLQGLVLTPDGSTLFVADFSHGLLRMDVVSGRVSRLIDAPHSTSLGCDGLAWYKGTIVAVQNGVMPPRIVRFHLDEGQRAITRVEVIDRHAAIADEPTIGTIVGDRFVYVANSPWEKHDEAGRPRAGVTLTPPILLAVPLR